MRELKGFSNYRVKRFRIVYSIDRSHKIIRIVAVGHRRSIYEEVVDAKKSKLLRPVLRNSSNRALEFA